MIGLELQLCRIAQLSLTRFRNYGQQFLSVGETPLEQGDIVALVGPNGAGKTNVLEALSLFAPGRGLRGGKWADFHNHEAVRNLGHGHSTGRGFGVAAHCATGVGVRKIGLGIHDPTTDKREYRLDGERLRSASGFADFLAFVWLTPQQDGLFRGATEERRRFIDQLASALDANYASELAAYQNSARQRLKLLKEAAQSGGQPDANWLTALEDSMARHAISVAVTRRGMVRQLTQLSEKGHAPFPGARLALEGVAEKALDTIAAVEVEDQLRQLWLDERGYDQRYGRTHSGPHRSDLLAWHSEHGMAAQDCSTGEQKAMLIAILLSHAQLIENQRMVRPILLLDEATAHLDPERRVALLDVLGRFGGQCWLTGTDLGAFPGLDLATDKARVLHVQNGNIGPS